jgi:hydroxymethylbilane synthase
MKRTIRIASRRSQLAMRQTHMVSEWLQRLDAGIEIEIVPVVTKGDQILDVALAKVGGKGLFVSEVEQTLLEHRADLAVHSMKDVPASLAPGLVLAGIPKREDPRDALISRSGASFDELQEGAVVGTSSLRRAAQVRALRPNLKIRNLRGNIDTRLGKLDAGDYDAILLAAAGLRRMGWAERITEYLAPDVFVPAIAQGILGLECRQDDAELVKLLSALTDQASLAAAEAERSLMRALNGSCQVPLAGHATVECNGTEQTLTLRGLVADPEGSQVLTASETGTDPEELGRRVAVRLLEQGAGAIIEAAESQS